MISTLSELMDTCLKTVSNWKKEKRPIMTFLYKYFSKEELEEFLNTGKVEKLELIKNKTTQELEMIIKSQHNQKILEQIEELKQQLK